MNSRDVILVGAGVVVGYLLGGYMRKMKDGSATTDSTSTSTTTPVVDQAKIDACNKEADDFMAMVRPTAGTDLVALRKEKFDACMAKNA